MSEPFTIPRLHEIDPGLVYPIGGYDFEITVLSKDKHIVLIRRMEGDHDLTHDGRFDVGRVISIDIVGDKDGKEFHIAYNLNGIFVKKMKMSQNSPLYLIASQVPGDYEICQLLKQEKYRNVNHL
jgi:hypothetical protein